MRLQFIPDVDFLKLQLQFQNLLYICKLLKERCQSGNGADC